MMLTALVTACAACGGGGGARGDDDDDDDDDGDAAAEAALAGTWTRRGNEYEDISGVLTRYSETWLFHPDGRFRKEAYFRDFQGSQSVGGEDDFRSGTWRVDGDRLVLDNGEDGEQDFGFSLTNEDREFDVQFEASGRFVEQTMRRPSADLVRNEPCTSDAQCEGRCLVDWGLPSPLCELESATACEGGFPVIFESPLGDDDDPADLCLAACIDDGDCDAGYGCDASLVCMPGT